MPTHSALKLMSITLSMGWGTNPEALNVCAVTRGSLVHGKGESDDGITRF